MLLLLVPGGRGRRKAMTRWRDDERPRCDGGLDGLDDANPRDEHITSCPCLLRCRRETHKQRVLPPRPWTRYVPWKSNKQDD